MEDNNTATNQFVEDWHRNAECSKETELAGEGYVNAWIDEESRWKEKAKDICINHCPVRMTCLKDAINDPESYGLRGGFFFHRGAVMAVDRKAVIKLGITVKTRQKERKRILPEVLENVS